jgi:hypothetical protein
MSFEVISSGLFELLPAAVYSSTNLFFIQRCEKALNHVDPGGAGGREVDMEAWPFSYFPSQNSGE